MPVIHDGMHPDPEAARALAGRMDRELIASLDHIADACRHAGLDIAFDRAGFASRVGAGEAIHPAVYGCHFDLLDAVADGDGERIASRFALIAATPVAGSLEPVPLDDGAMGDGVAAIYRRFVDADAGRPLNLVAPDLANVGSAARRIAAARAIIAAADPAFDAEFATITRQLVMARHRLGAPNAFGGASTFFLWGGLFYNPEAFPTPLELADTLIHESTHGLLFALAMDEPVTLNDKAARYSSPLRDDARPMEGIFHATCVVARTHLFHGAVAKAATLDAPVRAEAARLAALCIPAFESGYRTIAEHGQLSATGRRILDAAAAHMQEFA